MEMSVHKRYIYVNMIYLMPTLSCFTCPLWYFIALAAQINSAVVKEEWKAHLISGRVCAPWRIIESDNSLQWKYLFTSPSLQPSTQFSVCISWISKGRERSVCVCESEGNYSQPLHNSLSTFPLRCKCKRSRQRVRWWGTRWALVCSCQHHTVGADCQRCHPFYQDRPLGQGHWGLRQRVSEWVACFLGRCHKPHRVQPSAKSSGAALNSSVKL